MLLTFTPREYVHDTAGIRGKQHFSFNEAKEIGDVLGIRWDKFDVEQFRMGLNIEREHGRQDMPVESDRNEPMATGRIALGHLDEISDYYTQLAVMSCSSLSDFHAFRFLLL